MMFQRELGFVDDLRQRLLGHAGIVLERQRAHFGRFVDVAHQADEGGDRADARIARAQALDLARDVEILGLDSDRHFSLR